MPNPSTLQSESPSGLSSEQRQFHQDIRRAVAHQRWVARQSRGLSMAAVAQRMASPAPGVADAEQTLRGFGVPTDQRHTILQGIRTIGGLRTKHAPPVGAAFGGTGPIFAGSIDNQVQVPSNWGCAAPDFTNLDTPGYVNVDPDSDFPPPQGLDRYWLDTPEGQGPWSTRIRLALAGSLDATPWQHTGVTIADQADVPSFIVWNGTLYMFYVQYQDADGNIIDRATMASTRDLRTWKFKVLEFDYEAIENSHPEMKSDKGRPWTRHPVDPTVVRDELEGVFRMYFTLGTGVVVGVDEYGNDIIEPYGATFSAHVDDLDDPVWVLDGDARYIRTTESPPESVLDPSVLYDGDSYELFAGGSPNGDHHAESLDGLEFQPIGSGYVTVLSDAGHKVLMSNGYLDGSTPRYFGFTNEAGAVVSATRDASATWGADPGVRLEVDPSDPHETRYVKDPAVQLRPDQAFRCYVMAYVTRMPRLDPRHGPRDPNMASGLWEGSDWDFPTDVFTPIWPDWRGTHIALPSWIREPPARVDPRPPWWSR